MSFRGKIWWNELNTWDTASARDFYARTMGWTYEEIPPARDELEPYWIVNLDGQRVCGIFALRSPDFDGIPSHWFTYIAVDDLDKEIENTLAAGGSLSREKVTIPGYGTFAVVMDSTKAGFGMIQPEKLEEPG